MLLCSVSVPLRFSHVREILWFLFAKCGMRCPSCYTFSMILTLRQRAWIAFLVVLLDIKATVHVKLFTKCTTCVHTVSLKALEHGGNERCVAFLLPIVLFILHFGDLLKPFLCVWQCHRREGGVEDIFTSLVLNCLRCKEKTSLLNPTLY